MTDAHKQKIRKLVLQTFQTLTSEQLEQRAEPLYQRLLNSRDVKRAKTIAITISTKKELPTKPIIERLWQMQKRVVVPIAHSGKNREMTFHHLRSFSEVERSAFGIDEPNPFVCEEVSAEEIDVVIVPGVAFDNFGYRIGFGGGYYDRFLQSYHKPTYSLFFDFQCIHNLPVESHDVPVKNVIMERNRA